MITTPTSICGLTLEIGEIFTRVEWNEAKNILLRENRRTPLPKPSWRFPTLQEAEIVHAKLGLGPDPIWTLDQKNTFECISVFYPNRKDPFGMLNMNEDATLLPVRLR